MSKTIEMVPLSPADCLLLATSIIGEALIAAHPNVDLLPPGSDVVLHEKSGGGNPLFVRNIAIVSKNVPLNVFISKTLRAYPAGHK